LAPYPIILSLIIEIELQFFGIFDIFGNFLLGYLDT